MVQTIFGTIYSWYKLYKLLLVQRIDGTSYS